jgi:hypothetical protein
VVICRPEAAAHTSQDEAVTGDQYVFVALACASKAIVSYRIGKRNSDTTDEFVADLRWRVIGQPEISTVDWFGTSGQFGKPSAAPLLTVKS